MKALILLALTLVSVPVFCQRGEIRWQPREPNIISNGFPEYNPLLQKPQGGDTVFYFNIYDTVPVLFMVTDTTRQQPDHYNPGWPGALWDAHHMVNCWICYGFEVKYNQPTYDTWTANQDFYTGWRNHWTHLHYLDGDKTPVPKDYLIFPSTVMQR